ncbi:hypothetical protein Hdeb2414_s0002g00064981 [Helianthus debilis subsp. tardiflorus]
MAALKNFRVWKEEDVVVVELESKFRCTSSVSSAELIDQEDISRLLFLTRGCSSASSTSSGIDELPASNLLSLLA